MLMRSGGLLGIARQLFELRDRALAVAGDSECPASG